jgi:hypothetical protein
VPPTRFVAEHRDGTSDDGCEAEQDMDADNGKEDRISGRDWDTENHRRVFVSHPEA